MVRMHSIFQCLKASTEETVASDSTNLRCDPQLSVELVSITVMNQVEINPDLQLVLRLTSTKVVSPHA